MYIGCSYSPVHRRRWRRAYVWKRRSYKCREVRWIRRPGIFLSHSICLYSSQFRSNERTSKPTLYLILYCTVPYRTVPYRTVLHSTPLHSTPLHSTPLHPTPPHPTSPLVVKCEQCNKTSFTPNLIPPSIVWIKLVKNVKEKLLEKFFRASKARVHGLVF